MRSISLIGLLLVSLTTYVAAAAESNVIPLTEATFDKETKDHVWFVKFYAPWCGHCKKLAPSLDQMSIDPQIVPTDLRIGKVDCTAEQSICERFSIQGYPTLKVVIKGRYYDYEGARDIPSMTAFALTGHKDAHSEQVPTQADLEAFKEHLAAEQVEMEQSSPVQSLTSATFEEQVIQSDHPWMLKFYAPWCGHCKRLAPTWHRLSKSLKESKSTTLVGVIDCTVHRRVCSRFGVNGYPTLLYIRNGTVYKYQNARNLNAFIEFVESGWENAPSLGPIPNETFWSGLVDHAMEWAGENTALAIVAGILFIAIIVALLVALLDYCMAEDDLSAYRPVPRPTADDDDGEQTPTSTGTKPTVDKPKAE